MERLATFLAASVLLTITPGPDILFVFTQGLTRGRRAGLAVAFGLCTGLLAHTALAAAGVSIIFRQSRGAFNLLKFAGAAYLLHLAWRSVRPPTAPSESPAVPAEPASDEIPAEGRDAPARPNTPAALKSPTSDTPARLYRVGIVMNLLNPKVALFFLAFLPQFVAEAGPSPAMQMLTLGGLFIAQALAVFTAVGLCAGTLGRLLPHDPRMARAMDWLRAAIFALLAAALAWQEFSA